MTRPQKQADHRLALTSVRGDESLDAPPVLAQAIAPAPPGCWLYPRRPIRDARLPVAFAETRGAPCPPAPAEHGADASMQRATLSGPNDEESRRLTDVDPLVHPTGRWRWFPGVAEIRRLVEHLVRDRAQTRWWLIAIIAQALVIVRATAAAARGRTAPAPGVTQTSTGGDPAPQPHGDLHGAACSSPARTGRASGANVAVGEAPDLQNVIKLAERLIYDTKYVRARAVIHRHLETVRDADAPMDPLTVLRIARIVVCCDPRGIDPATLPWAWRYYRAATRRHGPGQRLSADAARRLVAILCAGGHADQLACFYREVGDDFQRFGLHREALRARLSSAQVLHQMGHCVAALRQLERSVLQWREATDIGRVEVAVVLAMLHLPMVCGHPRQARRMLRQLPAMLPPAATVRQLLLGVHHSVNDHRSHTGHRRVCTIAAPGMDIVSERRAFLAELRAAASGRQLPELIDDDYLGPPPPVLRASERIALRTGSDAPRTATLAKRLRCGVADVERLVHAAADTGQSRLIIDGESTAGRVFMTADGARSVHARRGRSGTGSGPQPILTVFQDVRR